VADAARGDHSLVDVERRDAADREAVSPMDVGHADRRPDDPRKTGDVRDLLDRSVVADVLHEPVVREDDAVRQHRADARDPKASRIHLLNLDLTVPVLRHVFPGSPDVGPSPTELAGATSDGRRDGRGGAQPRFWTY